MSSFPTNPTPRCRALSCTAPCEAAQIFCRRHWGMLPDHLQHDLAHHYTPGQSEPANQPTPEWMLAAVRARNCLALKERLMSEPEARRREAAVRDVVEKHNLRTARDRSNDAE